MGFKGKLVVSRTRRSAIALLRGAGTHASIAER
jgi:hypothetical protein